MQGMLNEVVRLCQLGATVPMSQASAERSFSVLRHLKTALRATMTQRRFCNLILLQVYQARAMDLDRLEILREFVCRRPETRTRIFGVM